MKIKFYILIKSIVILFSCILVSSIMATIIGIPLVLIINWLISKTSVETYISVCISFGFIFIVYSMLLDEYKKEKNNEIYK